MAGIGKDINNLHPCAQRKGEAPTPPPTTGPLRFPSTSPSDPGSDTEHHDKRIHISADRTPTDPRLSGQALASRRFNERRKTAINGMVSDMADCLDLLRQVRVVYSLRRALLCLFADSARGRSQSRPSQPSPPAADSNLGAHA